MCAETSLALWMGMLSYLHCFVIRYFWLQVEENPDSTSSNNEESVLSPNKKPGGWVGLDWFTKQVSVSTGQPGSSNSLFCG